MKLNVRNNAILCTVCIFEEEEEEMTMMMTTLFNFSDTFESSMVACFAIDTKIFTPVVTVSDT